MLFVNKVRTGKFMNLRKFKSFIARWIQKSIIFSGPGGQIHQSLYLTPSAEKTLGSDVKGDAFWLLSSTTNVLENK